MGTKVTKRELPPLPTKINSRELPTLTCPECGRKTFPGVPFCRCGWPDTNLER